jgi:type VI secretion system secreted protein VgrG
MVAPAGPALLGSAGTFAILAGSAITITGPTTIVGDVGVSPGTAISGMPVGQPTGGSVHVADAVADAAQIDLTTAYNDLEGRACDTDMSGVDLGTQSLLPGVYCFGSSAQLTGTVTLDGDGDPNATFVFQCGSTLTTSVGAAVVLINGAQDENVYWKVGSSATIGVDATFVGNIVALTSITVNTGASFSGRVLARNGMVTMSSNALTPTRLLTWGRLKTVYR